MKYISLALAAATFSAGSAMAADLPSRKGPPAYVPPPPVFSWTGFYLGANIGGGWFDNYNVPGWGTAWNGFGWFPVLVPGGSNGQGGVVGGGQVGYNYQLSPMFIVGVETDIQGTSIGPHGSTNNFWSTPTRSVDWFGTVRGRIGVSLFNPQLMIYGTGGFAYGDLRLFNGWWGSQVQTATGWTVGGGLEYALLPNWFVKAEYLYTNIGATYPGTPSAQHRIHMHTVRAGLNYRLNLFAAPAPVLASY